jgi:hypothetical protein
MTLSTRHRYLLTFSDALTLKVTSTPESILKTIQRFEVRRGHSIIHTERLDRKLYGKPLYV